MKIGIITMHKVRNFGSVLQAYALQQVIKRLGFDNEIIDYRYPKKVRKNITFSSAVHTAYIFLCNLIVGFPKCKQQKKFDSFYRKNLSLSSLEVNESSVTSLPIYDGYITGSDQVWNPRFAGHDTNFMLAFAPDDKPKISYASSFATTEISGEFHELYARYLSRYDSISVREQSGVTIVKELTGMDASVCCDPTLLLRAQEWDKLAKQSNLNLNYKYILVYPIKYMYNPYPKLYDIVSMVQKELGYMVIYLEGRKEDAFRTNSKLIKSAGPEDFVYLIKNAEFVVTTSFHGAAFSMIYNKPMFGLVNKANTNDSRMQSLLKEFAALDSLIDPNQYKHYNKEELMQLKGNMLAGESFAKRSKEVLSKMLNIFYTPKL